MNDFSHIVTAEATKTIVPFCCPSHCHLLVFCSLLHQPLFSSSFIKAITGHFAAVTFCSGKNQRKTSRHQDKTLINSWLIWHTCHRVDRGVNYNPWKWRPLQWRKVFGNVNLCTLRTYTIFNSSRIYLVEGVTELCWWLACHHGTKSPILKPTERKNPQK